MLDSDIIIWLLRGNREILAAFDAAVREEKGNVCISPVQLAEIRAGMRDNERVQVERMLATFRVIPIDEKAGVVAGEYLRQYAKTHSVTLADAFIAATAQISGAYLWTLNRKHFPMIDEENFYSPQV